MKCSWPRDAFNLFHQTGNLENNRVENQFDVHKLMPNLRNSDMHWTTWCFNFNSGENYLSFEINCGFGCCKVYLRLQHGTLQNSLLGIHVHGNSHGMRRLGRETLPGKALVQSDRLNFHLPSLAVNHLKAKWANAMCYSSRSADSLRFLGSPFL